MSIMCIGCRDRARRVLERRGGDERDLRRQRRLDAVKRPGFELGVQLAAFVKSRPQLRGVVLANHGLICWGDTSKACYDNTIDLVTRAANYLNERLAKAPAFGGQITAPKSAEERRQIASSLKWPTL